MPRQPTIRLTGTSYAVIGLVELAGEATPYDLKGMLESSIANFWPVQHTTFYGEPARLAKSGYLDMRQEKGGRRRKVYTVTAKGSEALREWVAEPAFTPPQVRDETTLRIFLGADPAPLLEARLQYHRDKLAELEGHLEAVRAVRPNIGGKGPGVERSLLAGTFYHRTLLEGGPALLGMDRRSK